MYSLNANEMCRTCSTESFINCTFGGHNLFPKDGYWRFNENSSNFIQCPLEEACIGGGNAEYFSVEFYSGEC